MPPKDKDKNNSKSKVSKNEATNYAEKKTPTAKSNATKSKTKKVESPKSPPEIVLQEAEKPTEFQVDSESFNLVVSNADTGIVFDETMSIDWDLFEATEAVDRAKDVFDIKPQEIVNSFCTETFGSNVISGPDNMAEKKLTDNAPVKTTKASETVSTDGEEWQDIFSLAFGESSTATRQSKAEATVSDKSKTSDALDYTDLLDELSSGSSAKSKPVLEIPLEVLNELTPLPEKSEQKSTAAMDDWLGSLVGEAAEIAHAVILPEEAVKEVTITEPATGATGIDSFFDGLFEVPSEESAVKKNNEPYLVAENTNIFIDETPPENTPSFEARLDTMAISIDDTINPTFELTNNFTFIESPIEDSQVNAKTEHSKPPKEESIVLDSGIIVISDEPLPITPIAAEEQYEKPCELLLTDNNLDDLQDHLEEPALTFGIATEPSIENFTVPNDTMTLRLESNESYSVIQGTEGYYHLADTSILVSPIGGPSSVLETFLMDNSHEELEVMEEEPYDVEDEQTIIEEEKSSLFAITSQAEENTETIATQAESILSLWAEDISATSEPQPASVETNFEPPKMSDNLSLTTPMTLQAKIRFIPVKNAEQNWIFSVVNFGSFEESQSTKTKSDSSLIHDINTPFVFDFDKSIPNKSEVTTRTSSDLTLQFDNHFDDLDFDFTGLFSEEGSDISEITPALEIESTAERKPTPSVAPQPFLPDLAVRPKGAGASKNSNYSLGQKVLHPSYGAGTIQKIIQAPHQNAILQIEFEAHGKRLLDPTLTQLKGLETAAS